MGSSIPILHLNNLFNARLAGQRKEMKKIVTILCLVVLLGASITSFGQQRPVRRVATTTMTVSKDLTVADVIAMIKARFSEELILDNIKRNGKVFSLSVNEQIQLKDAGASETIIRSMMGLKGEKKEEPKQPAEVKSTIIKDPPTEHKEALTKEGFYLGSEYIRPISFHKQNFSKLGAIGGTFTWGAVKTKQTGILRGTSAQARTVNRTPRFSVSNLDFDPQDYILVKMNRKKDSREVQIGKIGFLGKTSTGPSENTIPYVAKKTGSGKYEISTETNLASGEYAFIQIAELRQKFGTLGANADNVKVYDFGID